MRFRVAFAAVVVLGALTAEVACGEQLPASDDGSAADASTETDANGGGDGASADASRPFCDDVDATLCWSFDDATNGDPLFGPHFTDVAELVSLTKQARSAPNAMEARNPGDASGQWLLKKELVADQFARCTVAVYVEELTNHAEVLSFDLAGAVFAILLRPLSGSTTSVTADVMINRTGPVVAPGGLQNIPVGQWVDVTLTAEQLGSDLKISGTTLGASASETLAGYGAYFTSGNPLLRFGYHVPYGGKGTVRIDDVRCDYQ